MNTFCSESAGIWQFVGDIIYIIRIVIPIIIILLGTIDLGKAVVAGEDKKVKEAQKSFIKRLIYGVAIFFIFVIVEVIFGLLGVETKEGDSKICWDCATKPHSASCNKYVEEQKEKEKQDEESSNDQDTQDEKQNDEQNSYKEEV